MTHTSSAQDRKHNDQFSEMLCPGKSYLTFDLPKQWLQQERIYQLLWKEAPLYKTDSSSCNVET